MALRMPVFGVLLAIAITASMDAAGYSAFSALPLFPLLGLFWALQKVPRRNIGLVWGCLPHYGLALLYPIAVMGFLAVVTLITGAAEPTNVDWSKAAKNFALVGGSTVLVAILTEEGFFRGWLWASLERAGKSPPQVLIATSLAFALWHVSAVTLETGFEPPPAQVPVYLINVIFIGAIWGLLRALSGSVIVASVSHGIWNGFAYVFFGFGEHVGALGIANTALYGPEIGVLGLLLNIVFTALLWRHWRARPRNAA